MAQPLLARAVDGRKPAAQREQEEKHAVDGKGFREAHALLVERVVRGAAMRVERDVRGEVRRDLVTAARDEIALDVGGEVVVGCGRGAWRCTIRIIRRTRLHSLATSFPFSGEGEWFRSR